MSSKKKTVKVDGGYLNALIPAQLRGRRSNYGSEMMGAAMLMQEPILQASYIHNATFRNICDVPAEEMTRAGFKLKGLSDDEQEAIKSDFEVLNASKNFSDAIKWRNAFGGALVVLGINDGGGFEDEVDESSITDIEFMKVYDRFEARPIKRYETQDKNFGKIEYWQVSPHDGTPMFDIHSSRVLVFDGQSVPNQIRHSNDGWGAPVIQTCFKSVIRLDTAYKLSIDLLERMQQAVHKIPDLSEQVATPDGEAAVTKRVEVVDTVRGLYNTIIIDALEEYEIKSLTLTGVKDILDKNAEKVSSDCRIPIFILLGRTEGGLNSNGESSKEGWYTQVGAWQIEQLKNPIDRLVTLLLAKSKKQETKYTLEFNPLYTPSAKDQAEIDAKKAAADKAKMETLTGYVNAGMMDQDEGREEIREQYNLVGDAPEPVEELPEPMVLNPGQKIVKPEPGQHNPAPVGKK